MLHPELEERLYHAGRALKDASSENIIELCKQYLALLDEYGSFANYRARLASSKGQRLFRRLKRSLAPGTLSAPR